MLVFAYRVTIKDILERSKCFRGLTMKGSLMEKGYFAAAWGDVAKSPGWASVLLRLGLLCLVPVFGVVVMYGYLFSWARDIAWNVHRPLPKRYLPTKTEVSISVVFHFRCWVGFFSRSRDR